MDHIVCNHVNGEVKHLVVTKTGCGNRLLVEDLYQGLQFLPIGGLAGGA